MEKIKQSYQYMYATKNIYKLNPIKNNEKQKYIQVESVIKCCDERALGVSPPRKIKKS